jgi:hypothetical protein
MAILRSRTKVVTLEVIGNVVLFCEHDGSPGVFETGCCSILLSGGAQTCTWIYGQSPGDKGRLSGSSWSRRKVTKPALSPMTIFGPRRLAAVI